MTSQTKQRMFFLIKLSVGAACFAWALSMIRPSTWTLAGSHMNWVWLMIAAWVLNQVFCALRLRVLLSIFGYKLGIADAIKVAFASFFMSGVLPGLLVGDVAKIAILRFATKNSGIGELTMVTLLDRLFGLLSLWLIAFGLSFIVRLPETVAAQGLLWLIRISAIAPVLCVLFLMFVAGPHSTWVANRFTGRVAFLIGRARSIARKLTLKRSLVAILIGVLPSSLVAVTVLVLAQAATGVQIATSLGEPGAFLSQALLAPTSIFVSTIPIAPAGIGVGQLTLAGIYQVAGLNSEVAVLLTTVVQISQLLAGCTIGLACFVSTRRPAEASTRKPVSNAAQAPSAVGPV